MKLRAELSKYSRGIRDFVLPENISLDEPMSHKSDSILFDGKTRTRKRIVLLTTGCDIGTCTMCPFPNESMAAVKSKNLCNQFDNSFKNDDINNHEVITIFCNGNFLSDREMPIEARSHMYRKFTNSNSQIMCIETLPQFVNEDKIETFKRESNGKRLAVFMGLQSSNDFIRNVAINTTCTKGNFEEAVKLLQKNDFIPVPFVMIKPPFLLEDEAIIDTIDTLKYLTTIGVTHATLCPTRVAPKTVLEKMYNDGMYQTPWIWSVIEILRNHRDQGGLKPMVNTTELKSDQNLDSTCAYGCPKCKDKLITNIEKFLFTRDFDLLDNLSCICQDDYVKFKAAEFDIWGNFTIEERIKLFLDK